MGITNCDNLNKIEDAFGVEFTHPAPVKSLTERINAYTELQAARPNPEELANLLRTTDHSEWGTLLENWAPRLAMAEALKSISHFRIAHEFQSDRANWIDVKRWHYLKQLPLSDTINEFVSAVNELGEDIHDANAAMLNGKGDAASRAHAAEAKLLSLREFNGIRGTNHAAFTAMIIAPPNLPTLYRRRANDEWNIGTNPENRAIEAAHRKAAEVRDRSVFGLRDTAAGNNNIPATENGVGVTFTLSAPDSEDDYLRRIDAWENLAIYRNR